MPLFKKDKDNKKEDRKDDRKDKVESRRNYRLEKINALKEKIYAVAAKRKWLFLIIAAAIAAYLVFKFV